MFADSPLLLHASLGNQLSYWCLAAMGLPHGFAGKLSMLPATNDHSGSCVSCVCVHVPYSNKWVRKLLTHSISYRHGLPVYSIQFSWTALQLLERARDPSFIQEMIGNTDAFKAVYAELCEADSSQSVFLLPPDSDLQQRLCALGRVELMQFAQDLYRLINMSAVRREVSKLLAFCGAVQLLIM